MNMRQTRKAIAAIVIIITLILPNITPDAMAAEVTSMPGIVNIASGSLNVRNSPSAAGTILTTLSKGAYVTLIGKSGDWWKVEYAASSYGYVSAKYITVVYGTFAARTSISSGTLNVHSGSGTSYPVKTTLPNGRTVLVLSQSSGWSRILFSGTQTGYVSTQYLSSIMAWPVPASKKINQYFGTHQGLDIGASTHGVAGDSVVAAQNGKVVYAGWLSGYGYVAYINSTYNGQPVQTRYAHLQSLPIVKAGDYVAAGQKIGAMGNTGTSTGVHLHFEVRLRKTNTDCIANADSTAANPLNYVN